MTRIMCPACNTGYQLPDDFMGRKLVCQRCQSRLLWTAAGVQVVESPVAVDLEVPEVEAEPVEETMLEAELEMEEAAAPPPPRPHRSPRGVKRRSAKKSMAMPAVIISLTVLVVLGVIICAVVLLVAGLTGNEARKQQHAHTDHQGPSGPQPGMPMRGGPFGQLPGAGNDEGNPPERLSDDVKAGFFIPSLEQAGLVSYLPRGPIPEAPQDSAGSASSGQPGPEFVRRIKQSSVFLRVASRGGSNTGSGFFCLEPGLIVTNAHVVGMMRPSDAPPQSIEVTVNSGEANATELTAEVVGVDRLNDLAVLKVRATQDSPLPFTIFPSAKLIETQNVYVAGFPLATNLGVSLSLGHGSVAALRREAGQLRKVQINGQMQPGNSGGPVFDAQGRVVGVSVAILGQTGINFAVPTEYIHDLVYGGVERLAVFPPVKTGAGIFLPVMVRLRDPLRRITEVRLESWAGPEGAERAPSFTQPDAESGDGPVQTTTLKLVNLRDGAAARAMVPLPELADGQAVYLRIAIPGNGPAPARWYAAVAHKPGAVLEDRPVTLPTAAPPEAAARAVFAVRGHYRLQRPGGDFEHSPLALFHRNEWDETPGAGGNDPVKIKYQKFEIGARVNDFPVPLRWIRELLPLMAGAGAATILRMDVATLERADQAVLSGTLDAASLFANLKTLGHPEGEIKFGKQWSTRLTLPLQYLFGRSEIRDVNIFCTCLGVDGTGERSEMVVELAGEVKSNGEPPALGWMRGVARIDVATGQVRTLYLASTLEAERIPMSVAVAGQMGPMAAQIFTHARVEYYFQRRPAATAAE